MPGEITKKSKKTLACELFEQGKSPGDSEVKALGLKPKSTYDYFQEWKRQKKVVNSTTNGTAIPPAKPSVSPGKPIEVGKITITPENWGMTQHGAILILDTYNKAKRDIRYGGTIGEFLCDICEFYRRVLNYKEVEYKIAASEERT